MRILDQHPTHALPFRHLDLTSASNRSPVALTPCLTCGTPATATRCPTCQAGRHTAMYGPDHRAERRAWAPLVESGQVTCWRCGKLIPPSTPWDLGHRAPLPRHPEHLFCNRSAGGSGDR